MGKEKQVYEYLLSHVEGAKTDDIVLEIPALINLSNSTHLDCAYTTLRGYVYKINHSPEYEKLIIFNRERAVYKIATPEEALRYRSKKVKELKTAVADVKNIDRKLGLNNQQYFTFDDELKVYKSYLEEEINETKEL